jgi:hypothetical protein
MGREASVASSHQFIGMTALRILDEGDILLSCLVAESFTRCFGTKHSSRCLTITRNITMRCRVVHPVSHELPFIS